MKEAFSKSATDSGATTATNTGPSVTIEQDNYDFPALMTEFREMTNKLVEMDKDNSPIKIKTCVESILGAGKKVGDLGPTQAELLADIIDLIKREFKQEEITKEGD